MNDSTVRIQSEIIRNTMMNIAASTAELRRAYDKLYDELAGADPQYDRPFERFILTFTRAMNDLQSYRVKALAAAADEMRSFSGAGAQSEVGRAVPGEPSAPGDPSAPVASTPGGRASREPCQPALVSVAGETYYAPELAKSL